MGRFSEIFEKNADNKIGIVRNGYFKLGKFANAYKCPDKLVIPKAKRKSKSKFYFEKRLLSKF